MDTKSQLKITISGASLTDKEKQDIIDLVMRKLNGEEEQMVFNYTIPEARHEKENKFKEKIDDVVWKLGVKKDMMAAKWSSMSDSTKFAIIAIGVPAITRSALAIIKEARLVKKEHRLQKEYNRRN